MKIIRKAITVLLLSVVGTIPAYAACTNGSTEDCNVAGSTLNPAAAFVDPNPPEGYTQCAGFINTPEDDVRWDWENNCAAFVDEAGNGLFMRVYDDATGAIIAGARLLEGVPLSFNSTTGYNFRTDLLEGEGFLDNPNYDSGLPGGTSLAFHENDSSFCGCGRPPSGQGTCDDIFTTNAANDKIFYVGGNSSNSAYEAVWGPPGPKNTCTLTNEVVAVRVAIYAGEAAQGLPSRFLVTKTFTDGLTDEVDVTLTCNGGLPLVQEFTIAGGGPGVTFVLNDVPDTGVTCTVTESGGPDGYTPVLNGGDGCTWDNVSSGLHTCAISNEPDPGMFTVNMDWVVPTEGGDAMNMDVPVTITCDAEITPSTDNDGDDWWYETVLGDGDDVTVSVDTTTGAASCWATQDLGDLTGIESENDCSAQEVAAGEDVSCTFTNTVFFEGIPTLSQYGLAILVLLTLGAGLVGFRRFA